MSVYHEFTLKDRTRIEALLVSGTDNTWIASRLLTTYNQFDMN